MNAPWRTSARLNSPNCVQLDRDHCDGRCQTFPVIRVYNGQVRLCTHRPFSSVFRSSVRVKIPTEILLSVCTVDRIPRVIHVWWGTVKLGPTSKIVFFLSLFLSFFLSFYFFPFSFLSFSLFLYFLFFFLSSFISFSFSLSLLDSSMHYLSFSHLVISATVASTGLSWHLQTLFLS